MIDTVESSLGAPDPQDLAKQEKLGDVAKEPNETPDGHTQQQTGNQVLEALSKKIVFCPAGWGKRRLVCRSETFVVNFIFERYCFNKQREKRKAKKRNISEKAKHNHPIAPYKHSPVAERKYSVGFSELFRHTEEI